MAQRISLTVCLSLLLTISSSSSTISVSAFVLPAPRHHLFSYKVSNPQSAKTQLKAKSSSLFDGFRDLPIPNPLERLGLSTSKQQEKQGGQTPENDAFDPSPTGLIRQAKRVVASELALSDPVLLAEDGIFRWIGPAVDQALSRTEYLAAGRFFDLRATFPDLDYRAHDFRVSEEDPATVRLTFRTTGTMRGQLRLRDATLPPNGQVMKCPPEAISLTFDLNTGKVIKLCTGFALDRLVGNTAGTTGVMAAAVVAGQSMSEWDLYPPAVVIQRFFGRPVPQLPAETDTFLAPFPETVMIQLAKGILASSMAAEDPSLLADEFTYCTPVVGPVSKKVFIEKYAKDEFNDGAVDPSLSHWRVDPFDPVRVWVDVSPSAPGYQGAPQAMSFAFDDEGFCTRITSGAVMDPSIGNGSGLGGPEGYRYAMKQGSSTFVTRPLPRALGLLKKNILQPFKGDEANEATEMEDQQQPTPPPPADAVSSSPFERLSTLRSRRETPVSKAAAVQQKSSARAEQAQKPSPVEMPKVELPKVELPKVELPNVELPKVELAFPKPISSEPPQSGTTPRNVKATAGRQKQASNLAAKEKQLQKADDDRKRKAAEAKKAVEAKQAAQQAANARQKQLEAQKSEAERKRRLAEEEKAKKAAAAESRRTQLEAQKVEAERKRQEAEKKKTEAEEKRRLQQQARAEAAAEKKRLAEEKQQKLQAQREAAKVAGGSKQAALERKERQQSALSILAQAEAAARSTISLFGLGGPKQDEDDSSTEASSSNSKGKTVKRAPPGVPTIKGWKKNSDGSITGNITGSRNFRPGERITTSPIAQGAVVSGEVVTTGSGSKYFLS